MRLLIVGQLGGQISAATRIAMNFGAKVAHVDTIEQATAALRAGRGADLLMVDARLDIAALLAANEAEHIVVPIVAAGVGIDPSMAAKAIRAGAREYISLPPDPELIAAVLAAVCNDDRQLVAADPAMKAVIALADQIAPSDASIMITGESGVGKEVLARCIQGASERAGRPFVTVNCGAIPENLVESILFGHTKGSFTGATDNHAGKFVEANGGTLFLDEVGELPLDMQVKLLRVLQEGEVDPVGSKRPVKVDVRIVSATNKDLAKLVADGRFREDLYYRLNVFPIEAPPLRERKEDVPALVSRFVARFNAEEGRTVRGASAAAMQMLMDFDWPGNVRQLENSVFRAVILCEGDVLQPEDFPQISGLKPLMAANDALPADVPVPANDHHVTASHLAFSAVVQAAADASPQPVAVFDGEGHLRQLEQIERDLIELAIDHYSGHMSEVARRLGIGRSTLYRKLREYGLEEKAVGEG